MTPPHPTPSLHSRPTPSAIPTTGLAKHNTTLDHCATYTTYRHSYSPTTTSSVIHGRATARRECGHAGAGHVLSRRQPSPNIHTHTHIHPARSIPRKTPLSLNLHGRNDSPAPLALLTTPDETRDKPLLSATRPATSTEQRHADHLRSSARGIICLVDILCHSLRPSPQCVSLTCLQFACNLTPDRAPLDRASSSVRQSYTAAFLALTCASGLVFLWSSFVVAVFSFASRVRPSLLPGRCVCGP